MISINSEIFPLKKVLLHRPGNELLNLMPEDLDKMLYDDIPYLKIARYEHDEFASLLRKNGVEVVYLEELMTDVLNLDNNIKEKFIHQFVYEAGIKTPKYKASVIKFLMSFSNNYELVLKTMEGINLNELYAMAKDMDHSLVDLVTKEDKFLAEPMPNLVYTRDLITCIGNGVNLNKMNFSSRDRESIYYEYILNYHPMYKNISRYYDRYSAHSIEGGDILIINEHTIMVGISERTSASSIEQLALKLFKEPNSKYDTIITVSIPEARYCMHLDTVITQVDYDKFLYYPGIIDTLMVCEVKEDIFEGIKVKKLNGDFESILEKYLGHDITLIPCGGGDKVIAAREQWNDGVNVLCIAPGVVIAYERNNITNTILRRYGIEVLEIRGSELSRGRGGPRCMSNPIIRNR